MANDLKRATPAISTVGIGASAGGVEALQRFFAALPRDLGLAYVVVLHLAPDRDSELPAILQRQTEMPVVQVGDHEERKLEPDHVYVIAPDRKLELSDTAVGASEFERPRGQRAAIDSFFRSLARAGGDGFAVILSGSGTDGTLGARAVKEAGGLVLVQDPSEAAHDGMPRAVIASGAADVVLPARELAARLSELARSNRQIQPLAARLNGSGVDVLEDGALKRVLELLKNRTGHDFTKYKRSTIVRRLARRMQLVHRTTVSDYLEYAKVNVDELSELFDDLLINVTTFFRDPEAWAALQAQVIARLVDRAGADDQIRVWVPGCATGEEAYTLAILFQEEFERRGLHGNLVIFASDVDDGALGPAREGLFPNAIAADVTETRLERYFVPEDDHYRVVRALRDRIVFAAHSVLRDPPFSRLHLVSCRNLLIYLDRELQEQVMAVFRYACREDSFLFLGASETASSELFIPIDKKHRIFEPQRAEGGGRPPLPDLLAMPTLPRRGTDVDPRVPSRQPAGEAHLEALEEAAPPSVLVDERWHVLHLSSQASRFFEQSAGPLARKVTELVRAELRDELHAILFRAFEAAEPQLSPFLAVRVDGTTRRIAMMVQRRAPKPGVRPQALLTFLDAGVGDGARDVTSEEPTTDLVFSLREQVRQAERRADRIRDDHLLTNEDLRAANEELQSLNEEYRSTTEELETSKEELQSINEELQTVNQELKTKLEEASRARSDIENLMAATDVAILFLDPDLCVKRFTPHLSQLFNVKARDLDRPIGDVTHALDYFTLEGDARAILDGAASIDREATSRDGRAFIVRLNPYRISGADRAGGVVVTFIDVTEVKSADALVRDSERRLATELKVTRRLRDMTLVAATTSRLQEALEEILQAAIDLQTADLGSIQLFEPDRQKLRLVAQRGFRPSFLMQFGLADMSEDTISSRAARERVTHQIEDVTAEPKFSPYRTAAAQAGYRSVQSIPLIDRKGTLVGVLSTHYNAPHVFSERDQQVGDLLARQAADLIASRREQEELARLNEELQKRSDDLAEQARNKEEFLAVLGHELRNPLAAIVNSLDLAAPGEALPSGRLTLLRRQSRHLNHLVNDLLDITRINHGKLRLDRKLIDAVEYVREAAQVVAAALQLKGLELHLDVPSTPLLVDADPARLAQILDNLLRNAATYTEEGRVTVSLRDEGDFVRVAVTDTGIGIAAGEAAELFEAFTQVNHGNRTSGLGLGLALVKRLVEMHGGAVTLASEGLGRGSEFAFTVPRANMKPKPADAAREGPLPRRRILVVDDQEDNADMFGALLEALGQESFVAYNAAAALQIARDHPLDVAFLDLSMPDVSGRELARLLRQDFPEGALTLIALTGFGRDHPEVRGSDFSLHLLKPASIEGVERLLRSLPTRR